MRASENTDAEMIQTYITRFQRLRVNSYPRSVESLHKPCMLLAVLELAERDALLRNEIRYARPLLTAYERYYRTVEDPTRVPGAFYPFFHLKGDGFWHLHPRPRRDDDLAKMRRAGSERKVVANIDHARLDEALYALILDPVARKRLRAALVDRWFPSKRPGITEVVDQVTL